MAEITRSKVAMVLAAVAALLFMIGQGFGAGAYGSLTLHTAGTADDLLHTAEWFRFAAGLAALGGICAVGWQCVLRRAWSDLWEVSVSAVATLLIAIGWLIAAASGNLNSAPTVVIAVGISGWGLLVLTRAARQSLRERESGSQPADQSQAVVWLIAAIGLLVLAVGSGFTTSIGNKGTWIASSVLQAIGVFVLAAALLVARSRRYLRTRPAVATVVGLGVLGAAFTAFAVVGALIFGPGITLNGIRIGISIPFAIEALAAAVLGSAAWMRTTELASSGSPGRHGQEAPSVRSDASTPPFVPTPTAPTAPTPQYCGGCGNRLDGGGRFCSHCGASVV